MQWQIETFQCVTSTHDVAREKILAAWGRERAVEGMVILAGRQSAGRGQHGRAWASPRGGLYLSAVVEEVVPACRDRLALAAGVAVAEALDEREIFFSPERARATGVQLRWPNDLVLGDRKVGGILCESVAMGGRWAGIVGIGVNVVTALEELPAEMRPHATSLYAHDGCLRTVTGVLDAVLGHLARELEGVNREGLRPVIERMRGRDALIGRALEVEVPGEGGNEGRVVRGVGAGIAEDGALRVQTSWGIIALPLATLIRVDGRPLRTVISSGPAS